jgi:nitrogen fixation protein NifU and related proteins
MSVDDLYQEIILDHYRAPRNKGDCPACTVRVRHDNPLCGDEIELALELHGGRIRRVAFSGRGCAISQASASMMTEAVRDLAPEQALELGETVRRMMHGAPPATDLGDLQALEGVAQFPVRVKCALLPWMALRDALGRADGAQRAR